MRGLALPLLAALLLHGLALALAAGRPGPRQAAPAGPADDTPALLRLSRTAGLAAGPGEGLAEGLAGGTPGSGSGGPRPAAPLLPPPPQAREPQPASARANRPGPERASRPAPLRSGPDAATRLRQLQAEAGSLTRLWERAIPLPDGEGAAAGLPPALAGLPAAVERRRLPAAEARTAAAARAAAVAHGRSGPVPGGVLLVWHGGGGVWLLRMPLQGAAASAPSQGGGPRHETIERRGQVGGAEHSVAEPQHHPPGD